MSKATEKPISISVLTQTPGSEVLSSLARRLREHAKAINNPAARRTMGKDMVAAADAIDHMLLGLSTEEAAAVAMVVLLGRNGFAAWTGEH